MHWWFSATSALCAAVRPRLGTDQHVCTMGPVVSAPSGRRWGASVSQQLLTLRMKSGPLRVCVCECLCVCVFAVFLNGRTYTGRSNQSGRSCDVWWWRFVNWSVLMHSEQANVSACWYIGVEINIVHLQYDGGSSLITAALQRCVKTAIKYIFFVLGGHAVLINP